MSVLGDVSKQSQQAMRGLKSAFSNAIAADKNRLEYVSSQADVIRKNNEWERSAVNDAVSFAQASTIHVVKSMKDYASKIANGTFNIKEEFDNLKAVYAGTKTVDPATGQLVDAKQVNTVEVNSESNTSAINMNKTLGNMVGSPVISDSERFKNMLNDMQVKLDAGEYSDRKAVVVDDILHNQGKKFASSLAEGFSVLVDYGRFENPEVAKDILKDSLDFAANEDIISALQTEDEADDTAIYDALKENLIAKYGQDAIDKFENDFDASIELFDSSDELMVKMATDMSEHMDSKFEEIYGVSLEDEPQAEPMESQYSKYRASSELGAASSERNLRGLGDPAADIYVQENSAEFETDLFDE